MYQDQGREIWRSGGVLQLPAKANIQTYKLLSSWIRTHFAAGCGYDAPERTRDWVSCQTVNPVVEWKETDFYLHCLPRVTRQSKQRPRIPLQRKSHVKTKPFINRRVPVVDYWLGEQQNQYNSHSHIFPGAYLISGSTIWFHLHIKLL